MNIVLDALRRRKRVDFALGIQNYLLLILGSGAETMYSVADLVSADDFISFCTPPMYVACVDTTGDIAVCAVTETRTANDITGIMNQQCFQISATSVLHINTVGRLLIAVEVHYAHPVHTGTSSIYTLRQAIDVFRRIVGESYNVH